MEYDIANDDYRGVKTPFKRKINVFPAIETVKSASATVRRAIEYADAAQSDFVTPLIQTRDWLESWPRYRNPDRTPKKLNSTFHKFLKRMISRNDLEIVSLHLMRIMTAIHGIQSVIDEGEKRGRIPEYGNAVHNTIQKIHQAFFDWNWFQTKGTKFLTNSGDNLWFLWAKETQESLRSCESIVMEINREFFQKTSLYFGQGKTSHNLYLHTGNREEIERGDYHRFYFKGPFANYLHAGNQTPISFVLKADEYENILRGLLIDMISSSEEVRSELIEGRDKYLRTVL